MERRRRRIENRNNRKKVQVLKKITERREDNEGKIEDTEEEVADRGEEGDEDETETNKEWMD